MRRPTIRERIKIANGEASLARWLAWAHGAPRARAYVFAAVAWIKALSASY